MVHDERDATASSLGNSQPPLHRTLVRLWVAVQQEWRACTAGFPRRSPCMIRAPPSCSARKLQTRTGCMYGDLYSARKHRTRSPVLISPYASPPSSDGMEWTPRTGQLAQRSRYRGPRGTRRYSPSDLIVLIILSPSTIEIPQALADLSQMAFLSHDLVFLSHLYHPFQE